MIFLKKRKIGAKKSQVSRNPRNAKNLEFFHFLISFFWRFFQSFFNILSSLFCDCLKVIRFRQVFITCSSFFGRKCCKTQEIHEEIDENDAPLPHPGYLCINARIECKGNYLEISYWSCLDLIQNTNHDNHQSSFITADVASLSSVLNSWQNQWHAFPRGLSSKENMGWRFKLTWSTHSELKQHMQHISYQNKHEAKK